MEELHQTPSGFCSARLGEGQQNYPELYNPESALLAMAAMPNIDWVMHQSLSPVSTLPQPSPAGLTAPDSPSACNVNGSIRITAATEGSSIWIGLVWFFCFQLICLSVHWWKPTMVGGGKITQFTGFRQHHLTARQGFEGRDKRWARHRFCWCSLIQAQHSPSSLMKITFFSFYRLWSDTPANWI